MDVPPPVNQEALAEELARLRDLDSLLVLDTPPEPAFDNLALMASHLCATPAAIVSLITRDRQWFKAAVGLDPGMRETDRRISFCRVTVERCGTFVVEDTWQDPEFAGNPLVTGPPHIRFYAGVPLLSAAGRALGTLAVMDFVPRQISPEQIADLTSLAQLTMAQFELRRQHQATVRETEAQRWRNASLLAMAGRIAQLGGWSYAPAEKRLSWSSETAAILGHPEWTSPTIEQALSAYSPHWRRRLTAAVKECARSGASFELVARFRHARGELRWARVAGERVDMDDKHATVVQGALQDIDERHKEQRHALALAARLNDTLDSISDAVVVVDPQWRFVAVNKALERLADRPRKTLLGKKVWDEFSAAIGDSERRRYELAMAKRTPSTFEVFYRPRAMRLEVRIFPSRQGLTVYHRDITRERDAAERLRLLKASVDHLNEVVMITDARPGPEGPCIVFVNAAVERVCGYRPEEMIGRTPRMLQGEETDRQELDRIHEALAKRRPITTELLNYTKSRQAYWIELAINPVTDEAGRCSHFCAIERDITERRQASARQHELEAQLLQAQKMESVGTLAGGIAHDFNNILGAILGHLEIARAGLPAASPVRDSLEHIHDASLRARALVQQILAFSRRQPQRLVDRRIAPVIEAAVKLLRATLPAGVHLHCRLALQPLLVLCDATQIEQVIINLCTNAWHALEGGRGKVLVRLDEAAPPPELSELPPAPGNDRWAHISVCDTGSGMDSETRARVFEPFFTTKPTGIGTGLGLAVVHGIVGAHGGLISLDSEPGAGSTFHIYLPAHLGTAGPPPTASEAAPAASLGSGQRVLYIDDDEVMLLMMEPLLRLKGFAPTCRAAPREAVQLLARDPRAFDIVITDYNMPDLSGADVARAVRRLRDDLPVVIVSGFVTEEQQEQARAIGALGPLHKQDFLDDLAPLILRETMRGAPGS